MLFDKELDESLSLILTSCEKKDEIIEFLKIFPKNLLEKIKKVLVCQNNLYQKEDVSLDDFEIGEDGLIYSYNLKYNWPFKSLTLFICPSLPDDLSLFHMNFSISLVLVKEYLPLELLKENVLGYFNNNLNIVNASFKRNDFFPYYSTSNGEITEKGYNKELLTEYFLVKNDIGYSVRTLDLPSEIEKNVMVDINKIKEIDLNNLDVKKKVKKDKE